MKFSNAIYRQHAYNFSLLEVFIYALFMFEQQRKGTSGDAK